MRLIHCFICCRVPLDILLIFAVGAKMYEEEVIMNSKKVRIWKEVVVCLKVLFWHSILGY